MKAKPNPKTRKGSMGRMLIDALRETNDALERGETLTVRQVHVNIEPPACSAQDIRSARESLRVSQAVFAAFLGTPLVTLTSWECNRRHPSAMARRFIAEIKANPDYWRGRLAETIQTQRC